MKRVGYFLKGALIGVLGILGLALLISLFLLIFNIDLNINNTFVTIYSYGGEASVKFHSIPTLIFAIIGGVSNLNKYKLDNIEDDKVENIG